MIDHSLDFTKYNRMLYRIRQKEHYKSSWDKYKLNQKEFMKKVD